MAQPVGPIPTQAPVPSILTTARDRTGDGFGTSAPVPAGVDLPDGSPAPSRHSWRNGVTWNQACHPSGNFPTCPSWANISPPVPPDKDVQARGDLVVSRPFWIYTGLECEWVFDDGRSLAEQAKAVTEAHTAYGLARALWLGDGLEDFSDQPTLRRAATDVTVGGAADLDDAVALLLSHYETATGGSGGAVLHVPSIMVTGALGGVPGGSVVIRPEGNVYRGPLGSLVSPGPGYPWGASAEGADGYGPLIDSGPPEVYAGNGADEAWVYVTGPVEYALGDWVESGPDSGLALRRNLSTRLAERQAIYRFDPCTAFAARALMTVTVEGS